MHVVRLIHDHRQHSILQLVQLRVRGRLQGCVGQLQRCVACERGQTVLPCTASPETLTFAVRPCACTRAPPPAACPYGTYKSSVGSGSCTACPSGANTTSTAATSAASCLCLPGFTGADGGPCTGNACVAVRGVRAQRCLRSVLAWPLHWGGGAGQLSTTSRRRLQRSPVRVARRRRSVPPRNVQVQPWKRRVYVMSIQQQHDGHRRHVRGDLRLCCWLRRPECHPVHRMWVGHLQVGRGQHRVLVVRIRQQHGNDRFDLEQCVFVQRRLQRSQRRRLRRCAFFCPMLAAWYEAGACVRAHPALPA